jgi:hypothetical protein
MSLISFNSIDTVESNNDEHANYPNSDSQRVKYTQNNTFESMDMSLRFGEHISTSNVLNNVSNRVESQQQQIYMEKLNTFYSASFMDENMNLLCSINSICLNRKREKENVAKEPNPTLVREKNLTYTSNNAKRPSIQLRRKNRFVV